MGPEKVRTRLLGGRDVSGFHHPGTGPASCLKQAESLYGTESVRSISLSSVSLLQFPGYCREVQERARLEAKSREHRRKKEFSFDFVLYASFRCFNPSRAAPFMEDSS